MEYDVIIVGAGPIGLFLGNLLGKDKIRTLILEKEIEKKGSAKAIGVTPPSLKMLKNLGMDKELIKNGVKINTAVIHGSKKILGKIYFDKIPAGHKFILSIPQPVTEKILEKNINKHKSVTLKKGRDVNYVSIKNDRVEVKARNIKTKKIENYSAEFLAGCDGKNSFVRNFLKIPFKGAMYKDTFLMADFIDKSGYGYDAHLFLTNKGPVESFPLPQGKRRWIISTEKYLKNPKPGFLENVVYNRIKIDLKKSKKVSESPFGVQHNLIDKYYFKNKILFCGDSSHVMSPIGGQGMNTGFADAELCEKVLVLLLNGKKNILELLNKFNYYRKKASRCAIRRASISMHIGTVKGKVLSAILNFFIFIFIRLLKNKIPVLYTMLTIPNGTFERIKSKDKLFFKRD